jgi:hypothetical protein
LLEKHGGSGVALLFRWLWAELVRRLFGHRALEPPSFILRRAPVGHAREPTPEITTVRFFDHHTQNLIQALDLHS